MGASVDDRDETNPMLIDIADEDAEDLAAVLQRIIRNGHDDAYIQAAVNKGCHIARARIMGAKPRRSRKWGITHADYSPPPRLVGASRSRKDR